MYKEKEINVNLITLVSLGAYGLVKQKLHKEGWDPNVQNEDGTTPALKAAERNDLQMLQLLIEKGAKMDTADKLGFTPLDLAKMNENKDMIELINGTINNVSDAGTTEDASLKGTCPEGGSTSAEPSGSHRVHSSGVEQEEALGELATKAEVADRVLKTRVPPGQASLLGMDAQHCPASQRYNQKQSKRPKTEMPPSPLLFYGFNAAKAPLFQKNEIGTTNRPNRENLIRTGEFIMLASSNVRYPNDVIIQGLQMNVNETKIREEFSLYGKIIRVKIPKQKAPIRIAYITFENREVALQRFHSGDDATQHRELRDKVTSDNDTTPYHYGYQFM